MRATVPLILRKALEAYNDSENDPAKYPSLADIKFKNFIKTVRTNIYPA